MPVTKVTPNTKKTSLIIIVISVAILILSVWFWWSSVYLSSNNVFWGMIENNLVTNSVTRHIVQDLNGQKVDQFIRLQFGSVNASQSRVVLEQSDSNGKNIVKSETIGTPKNDFSRYIGINTTQKNSAGKPLDTKSIIGIWGKSADPKVGQEPAVQYFRQSILAIVPYGMFSQSQRDKLISQMQSKNVYDISSGSVKSQNQNGRAVFVYQIKLNPSAYVQLMQTYTSVLGLGDIGLDPSSYANSPPLKLELTVDKISRQVTKIDYPDSGQTESIVDQNIFQPITIPVQTIPIDDLQKRLQSLSQ